MEQNVKKLGTTSLVFNALATAFSMLGSILMFFDYKYELIEYPNYYYYYYDLYDGLNYYNRIDNPEAGIFPLIGFLFILGALFFIIYARKKNWKLSIGNIIFSFMAQPFLYISIIIIFHSDISIVGYVFCCVAGCLIFIETFISIVYAAYSRSYAKLNTNAHNSLDQGFRTIENTPGFVNNYNNLRLVTKLNELHRTGAISKEEYDSKKKQLLDL